jgi:hypothetical protein
MKIKREIFEIKGAPLKGTNPLPIFRARKYVNLKTSENYPEELKENGCYIAKVLPYLMQDRYSRRRIPLKLKSNNLVFCFVSLPISYSFPLTNQGKKAINSPC